MEKKSLVKPKTKKMKPKISLDSITHLYLNGKEIDEVPQDLDVHKNLKVLYLHKNKINQIGNLDTVKNLVHLFLQWNNIKKIENLDCLENLEKLYLGYNKISVLENLNNLTKLKELHIEEQDLPTNTEFAFHITSFDEIAHSLEILNVSKLNLTNLYSLKVLYKLKSLTACGNRFANPEHIGEAISNFPYLKKLNLVGCPAQKDLHYREKVTAGGFNLDYLDDKFITKRSREFIKRFEQARFEKMLLNLTKKDKPDDVVDRKVSVDMKNKKTLEDISFRPWNSLNFIKRTPHVKKTPLSPNIKSRKPGEYMYGLQGKNIKTGKL